MFSSRLARFALSAPFVAAALIVPATAHAASFTYCPSNGTGTGNCSPASVSSVTTVTGNDLGDLDHHNMYAWRVDGVTIPSGQVITGATLTLNNIYNWDTNPAVLYIHLFDTAGFAGTGVTIGNSSNQSKWGSYVDDPTDTGFNDNFANSSQAGYTNLIGGSTVGNTNLTTLGSNCTTITNCNSIIPDVNHIPTGTYSITYSLTGSQLTQLTNYISNGGDFALGFDPDCHFYNTGITFNVTTGAAPVPEPASLTLLGLGLAGAYARRRQLAKAAARS